MNGQESQAKRNYEINTNPSRHLLLLKYPINMLPLNQLPIVGNVIRYFEYLKSPFLQDV